MPAQTRLVNKARARRQRGNPNRPLPVSPVLINNAAVAANVLTLTFDQPVSLSGVPAYTTDLPGIAPVSAAQTGPAVVAITFGASIAGAVSLNVPFRDPAIRGASGGYVTIVQMTL
jgi:hypothetical protein